MCLPHEIARNSCYSIRAAIALLEGVRPQDEIEGMLAVQMAATHDAALEYLRRATIPEQTFAGCEQSLKQGAKLLAIYTQQMAALDKHRGKGQQKVTVEHVASGGQGIVENVEHGRASRGSRRQRSEPNRMELPSSIPHGPDGVSAPRSGEPARLKKGGLE